MEGKKKTSGDLGFGLVPNNLAQNKKISLKSIGLYAHMTSRPEDWHFTLRNLSTNLKDGRAAITSALDELKESGWVEYEKHQDGSGTYWIHREPNSENRTKTQIQKTPPSENPTFRKPERITKKDSLQRKSYYKERVADIKRADIKDKKDLLHWEVAKMWWNLFRENLIEAGSPTTSIDRATWKGFVDPIRLMIERDGISLEQFRVAYNFLKKDDFWKSNVLSTSKLRKQFEKLILQSKRNNGRTNQNGTISTGLANVDSNYVNQIKRDLGVIVPGDY